MDGFIGELGNRLKVSIPDSTMMSIVNHAMDKAHAKVKSDGVLCRLNEISRFYELAVIQLEGCMRLVQEEGKDRSHKDLLYDLGQVRDHLLCRLEEAEMAICQKDGEMMEIWETVLKLRQTLELREGELEGLKGGVMVEKRLGEDNMINYYGMKKGEGEFHDLKNSVDQQVWNMRNNYERSRINLQRNGYIDMDKNINRIETDIISNLKETFDMAFGKMQTAIFSCEDDDGPVEQQWKWSIERDVSGVLIKGFIKDIQQNHNDGTNTTHPWILIIRQKMQEDINGYLRDQITFEQSIHDVLLRNNQRYYHPSQ